MVDAIKQARVDFRNEVHAWWNVRGELPQLLWRDDDASNWSPHLEACLELATRHDVPMAFAAIPTLLTRRATETIISAPKTRIALHGYQHRNYASSEAESSEYPGTRDADVVLAELRQGLNLLKRKAGPRFLNMFVPPWGRFAANFDPLLTRAGLMCFSGGSRSPKFSVPLQLDCHICAEHGGAALDLDDVIRQLTRQLRLRRLGHISRDQPVGLLTHHRTFSPSIIAALDGLLHFLLDCGFSFSSFAEVDALKPTGEATATATATEPSSWPSLPLAPGSEVAKTAMMFMTARTMPMPDEGYPGLSSVLALLARVSPVALLRFAHLHHFASRMSPKARMLSAGCGKGIAEVALAMMYPWQEWVAVDGDSSRFDNMRRFAAELDVQNIRFEAVDLELAPREDNQLLRRGSFDAISVVEVLMYLSDPRQAVRDLGGLLKEGGQLFCIEPFLPEGTGEATVAALREHTQSRHGGFSRREVRDFVAASTRLELLRLHNCYGEKAQGLVATIWRQLKNDAPPGLLDVAFAMARLDLATEVVEHRRDATAVAFLARAI